MNCVLVTDGSGERKWLMIHLLRLGMVCIQPDQHQYCFQGNSGGSTERWGGGHMDHFNRYYAICAEMKLKLRLTSLQLSSKFMVENNYAK